ncbi:MAG TPA: DNRLRE domain-containing protein, partial [Planctomycetota bacterium]|nr:DNRLRE domain-containing protein [Planctomycetota bacterium]
MSSVRSYRSMVLLAGLLLVLWSSRVEAANTSGTDLGSDDDTTIKSGVNGMGQPGGSDLTSPKEMNLLVENDSTGNPERRVLIHFDLTQFTGLGAGSSVSSAILKMTYFNNSGATNGAPGTHLRVYRLTKLFQGGNPLDPTANVGASWDQAVNGTTLWATNGGDFTPAAGSGTLCTPATAAVVPAANNEVDFNITAIVNGWVNGSFPNDGLILMDDSESSQTDFYSIFEGADYGNGSAVTGPRLNVTYTSVTANSINASQDTSILSTINNVGAGHQTRLVGSVDERMLLKFPIGAIPGAENVQSAILRIKSAGEDFTSPDSNSGGQAGTDSVTVYKLTQPLWTEGTGKSTSQTSDGAMWDLYDGTNPWATLGGDFDATRAFVSPSTTISGTNADVVIDIDVTAIVAEQHTAAALSADFLIKAGPNCDWRMGCKEYAGSLPAAPRTAQLIVTSNSSPGPAITVTTPSLTQGASGTVNWTFTGLMNNFDVYLIDGSANVKKVNVAPVAAGAGTGSFTWVVNASAAPLTGPGAGFTVKVVETTKLFQGISGAFTISGPMSITTTSPIASATQNVAYAGVTFTA